MRGLRAPLSPNEEGTLRRIALGSGQPPPLGHLRRLQQLELVEWAGGTWRLTELGRRRHDGLETRRGGEPPTG
jgi:hypothetical protein